MGRHALQRKPSLARSRSEAEKTESRTRNNVQGGRETTSSPGPETTSTSPMKWTRNNVHIGNPAWTRTTSISRLTIWGGVGGSLKKGEQDKVPWSMPTLTE